MSQTGDALLDLGRRLHNIGYQFKTGTPLTHARVNQRWTGGLAATVEDIFGWSRPFRIADFPDQAALLEAAGEIAGEAGIARSRVRFSTLHDQIYLHSAYPTTQSDAVFFGPDTYRFARLIKHAVNARPLAGPCAIADIGCGSGAGGLYAASLLRGEQRIVLADINDRALHYSRINAELNGLGYAETLESDVLNAVPGAFDLIVSNPPYLVDAAARAYRHGGGDLGFDLSLRIIAESLPSLTSGGRLVLYTGSAIVNGVDLFRELVGRIIDPERYAFEYDEIDPDVFGEELDSAPYHHADRIAVIGLVVDRL